MLRTTNAVARLPCRLWRAHRRHLIDNAAYGGAVATAARRVLTQSEPLDLLAALAAAALAVRRAMTKPRNTRRVIEGDTP